MVDLSSQYYRILTVLGYMDEIVGHNTAEEAEKRVKNFASWKEYVLFEAVRLLLLAEFRRTGGP